MSNSANASAPGEFFFKVLCWRSIFTVLLYYIYVPFFSMEIILAYMGLLHGGYMGGLHAVIYPFSWESALLNIMEPGSDGGPVAPQSAAHCSLCSHMPAHTPPTEGKQAELNKNKLYLQSMHNAASLVHTSSA